MGIMGQYVEAIMIIYGAGMSGLLAATMLRRFEPIIHEAAAELPNNHAALLRFRTDAVSKATGIPFKKVLVQKAVMGEDGNLTNHPSIREQNLYSWKVSGALLNRSIGNLDTAERYIAPEDFISQMSKNLNIECGKSLDKYCIDFCEKKTPVISTIPMNALMKICGWSDVPKFDYRTITAITANLKTTSEIYQTIYYPNPDTENYRCSITGNKLIIEYIREMPNLIQQDLEAIVVKKMHDFIGLNVGFDDINVKTQKYGKLISSTGRMGKEFILAMTDLYGIYSLGRFATWRQILMDDVVKDVRVIEQMIDQRDSYSRRLKIV